MGNYLSWGEARILIFNQYILETYSEVIPGSQENAKKETKSESGIKQNNFHLYIMKI